MNFLTDWPGKSAVDGGPPHPAAYHMLDVAAVSELLLAGSGLPSGLRAALAMLAGLHDLGKMAPAFKEMLLHGRTQALAHWEVTEILLELVDVELLAPRLGAEMSARREIYAAVAGHHGRPSMKAGSEIKREKKRQRRRTDDDVRAFVSAMLDLWPDATLGEMREAEAKASSWWIAGLVNVADWIGSNAGWFPARQAGDDLPTYLERARRQAERAVSASGIIVGKALSGPLFDFAPPDFAPRPMQVAAADIALPDGPTLAIIEDETGAGKTEAAMILAQRMLLAGKGEGLFVALPSMAVADAMFARMRGIVGRMFARPSVTLAHGRADLSEAFREVRGTARASEDDVGCAPWLADGRRRALLAQVGVGTVDQALLGVLPVRFATLRLWGLSRKVLVVDEVHELGDPYMAVALERLLERHAAQGGSAILLTATLPLAQRAALVGAFERGAGREPSAMTPDYPALTVSRVGTRAVTGLPSAKGPVRVARVGSAAEAVAILVAAAGSGAACVWVRNAVDDAIAALDALRAEGVEAELLHARFALCDRKSREASMLGRFGKQGAGRSGRVLVATQVVESSLDLDFDVMVSDLAPVASLIQRAGRLWRHMAERPAAGRPVAGPTLHVVSPDPGDPRAARWLREVQPAGCWVYPPADTWRTARILAKAGRIEAPHGLRPLVEAVHGADAEPVPEVLERAEMEAEGERFARANIGFQNVVTFEKGYRDGGGGVEDRHYPTRLGRPQMTLALARAGALARTGPDGLVPWAGGQGAEAWMLSEVMAAAAKLGALPLPDQGSATVAAAKQDWPKWKRDTVTVCAVGEDGAICEGLRYDDERGLMFG